MELSRLAEEMDQLGKSGEIEGGSVLLENIEQEFRKIDPEIKAFLKDLGCGL
jgi:hypothetical protein